jgi:hypothetical protein
MIKKVLSLVFSVALIGASSYAFAKHDANKGGQSDAHMSTQGAENTNGPEATDRDKGQERAADQRSEQGAENEKAGADHGHHGKHKGGKKQK